MSTAKPFPVSSGEIKARVLQHSWHGTCALMLDLVLWSALQPRASQEKGIAPLVKYTLFGVSDQDKKMMQSLSLKTELKWFP